MSCKFCKPLESTGATEPLLRYDGVFVSQPIEVRICGNKLIMRLVFGTSDRVVDSMTVDFCPNCGEDLTPFGSFLFGRYTT